MKKTFLLLTFIAFTASAQIKIYNTNQISLGYTGSTAPITGMQTHAVGNTLFTATSTGTMGALIKGTDGYSPYYAPEYTWNGDHQTGIFHPSNNIIGFSTGMTERCRLTNLGNFLLGGTTETLTRLVVTAAANNTALENYVSHTTNYAFCQTNYVNNNTTKGLAIKNNASGSYIETFSALGSGDVWEKSATIWSDRSLKENINKLENSLTRIKQLNGVTYVYKASFGGSDPSKKEIGMIAQDVEKILPEVVNTNEAGIKGICYDKIIPLLIESIKEQQTQIDKLESELKETKNSSSSSVSSQNIKASLYQNTPNPFSERTEIKYTITAMTKDATLYVYNMNGTQLMSFPIKEKGNGSIEIEGSKFEPGMYLYSLIVDGQEVETKRMILTK